MQEQLFTNSFEIAIHQNKNMQMKRTFIVI